jgi:hypothetical protein
MPFGKITIADNLVSLSMASLDNLHVQISASLNIPLDSEKYVNGNNLIDCIDDEALADFTSSIYGVDVSFPGDQW